MFRTVLRGLLARRLRLALTALAITLGVGLMSGSFVLTATLAHSLDSLFTQASSGVDVVVLHSSPGGTAAGPGSTIQPIPASIAARVRQVPGVAAAEGQVYERAVLLGRDGEPLPARFGLALSWPAVTSFQSAYVPRTGRPPAGPGQVMIDRASARQGHYAVGDRITVVVNGQPRPFTISGITGYGSADSIGGGSMAIFSLGAAQQLFGQQGRYGQINVQAAPGVPAQQLRDRIAPVLPRGVEADTAANAAAKAAQQASSRLSILGDFFLGFAGICLLVAGFVIWNTFAIVVGQRTRELALLRALGAGRAQVLGSVLAEAAAVGLTASVAGDILGLALSRGLAALLGSAGFSLPVPGLVLPWAQLAAAIGTGVAVTLAAALSPAYRATRVAPVQALREAVPARSFFSAGRLTWGLACAAAGVTALLAGVFTRAGIAATGMGAAACLIAVTVLGPLAARPLAALAGTPLTMLPARTGVLARRNAMTNPGRTSSTATALMIGLAVIVSVAVLVTSTRATISGQVTAASKTSFYIQAVNNDVGMAPSLARAVARQPGVNAVTEVRSTSATVAGTSGRTVDGIDPSAIGQFTDLGVQSGRLATLSTGGMLVSAVAAASHHWRAGDLVQVQFGSYGTDRLRVDGVFANVGPLSDYLVSNATFTADTGRVVDNIDLVRAPSSARQAILAAVQSYLGAELLDQTGFIANQTATLTTALNLVTALLLLAIVIALLGIASTLALSVAERTRELGLLRAIGMRRGQLAQMVTAEAVIIAVIGAVLGTAFGLGLGTALADTITRSQQATVAIPGRQIAIYILLATLSGVLAAIPPARRAARLNMLAAIATE